MGEIKLKHYVVRKGNGYWLVTPKMKAMGFGNIRCGKDGPAAWAIAAEWEARWQAARTGREPSTRRFYPAGSFGEGFERVRKLDIWRSKAPRTREDWERGWRHIEPIFGDVAPRTVSVEDLDSWYAALRDGISVQEAHRAVKIWRALWYLIAAMNYCEADADPSFAIRRQTPAPRTATWTEGEAVRLAKEAWRRGYRGLACIIAVAYDTGLSPVDVRTLTFEESRDTGASLWFERDRAKTGRAAVGTLSRRTQALIRAYVADLPAYFIPSAPIFLTRRGAAYRKNSLSEDFRDIRSLVLPGDMRKLMDMRRTGAVEAQSGGADVGAISAKLANSLSASQQLHKAYLPVNRAAVGIADEARKLGRRRILENRSGPKVETLRPGELKPEPNGDAK